MGISPIDFDGSTLNNSTASQDISVRIIGGNGINSPTLGTAEPEMRGMNMCGGPDINCLSTLAHL